MPRLGRSGGPQGLSHREGLLGTRAPLHRPDPFFLLPSATLAAAKTAGKSELPSGKRGGRKPEGQGSVCVSVCGEQVRSGQWGKRVFELERKGRQEKRPRK